MSKVNSSIELYSAPELLRRSTEARNGGRKIPTVTIEELLERPKYPVLVKGAPLSEYLNPVQKNVYETFETETDLLSVFTGTRRQDHAFEGLGEGRFRYEKLYPKPYAEPYFMANCGAAEEDFGLPVLFASSDWAWTGWHVDSEPGADVVSQLHQTLVIRIQGEGKQASDA